MGAGALEVCRLYQHPASSQAVPLFSSNPVLAFPLLLSASSLSQLTPPLVCAALQSRARTMSLSCTRCPWFLLGSGENPSPSGSLGLEVR